MKNAFNKPESLAPVGGREQLEAAGRSGADAVYFGLQNFNARRNADNFSDEEAENAISHQVQAWHLVPEHGNATQVVKQRK